MRTFIRNGVKKESNEKNRQGSSVPVHICHKDIGFSSEWGIWGYVSPFQASVCVSIEILKQCTSVHIGSHDFGTWKSGGKATGTKPAGLVVTSTGICDGRGKFGIPTQRVRAQGG